MKFTARVVAAARCATVLAACMFAVLTGAARAADAAPARFNGTYWKLVEMDGSPAHFGEGSREAHILFGERNRVSGSGGCNRPLGGYRIDGARLSFGNLVGTMMGCEKGMEEERHLVLALGKVRGWSIDGPRLNLTAASGAVILRFQSGEPLL